MNTATITIAYDPIEPMVRVLFRQLAAEIVAGKYKPGEKLPSERMMMMRFGASRHTIRHVLNALEARRLIHSRQGKGTFVLDHRKVKRKVGVIVSGLSESEQLAELCAELKNLAAHGGVDLIVCDIPTKESEEAMPLLKTLAGEMIAAQVTGLLYTPIEFTRDFERNNRIVTSLFDQAGVQVVLLGRDIREAPARGRHDVIAVDDFNAGRSIVRHLRERGAKEIRYLADGPKAGKVQRSERLSGCCVEAGVQEAKLCVKLALEKRGEVARYMRVHPETDAFICESDRAAAKLIRALKEEGYGVPRDVKVVGCEDGETARHVRPTVTAVHEPSRSLARMAFDRLRSLLANPSLPACKVEIHAPLIPRESTK